jgi:competence CoiA-like predicted nuclease
MITPDIYVEDDNKKIAIEIQCSKISYEDFISRSMGINGSDKYDYSLVNYINNL